MAKKKEVKKAEVVKEVKEAKEVKEVKDNIPASLKVSVPKVDVSIK